MEWLRKILTARWRPAVLTAGDIVLATYAVVTMALLRAYDYGTGNDASPTLSIVEAAMPLGVWSALFAIGGLVLLIGARCRIHALVWTGHAWLFILYLALLTGIAWAVAAAPWFDNIRSASVLILPVLMHFLLALRTGPSPLVAAKSRPVAVIATAGEDDGRA